MNKLLPFPLSAGELERYRIQARQQLPPNLSGGHLTRRKGQSLEFREYIPYTLGDDIRGVDWRASARYGDRRDLLMRRFVAEEQLTLAISIDTRTTMTLPAQHPKLQIALWLAEAVARVALASRESEERVVLHHLFAERSERPREVRGSRSIPNVHAVLNSFVQPCTPDTPANVHMLRPHLPPTAIWLILSDFYFDPRPALAQTIIEAQDGFRLVLLVDLDSWPYEKAMAGKGARLIDGPGLRTTPEPVAIDDETLATVEARIQAHKRALFAQFRRSAEPDTSWRWDVLEAPVAEHFFRQKFLHDPVIRRLFGKDV